MEGASSSFRRCELKDKGYTQKTKRNSLWEDERLLGRFSLACWVGLSRNLCIDDDDVFN